MQALHVGLEVGRPRAARVACCLPPDGALLIETRESTPRGGDALIDVLAAIVGAVLHLATQQTDELALTRQKARIEVALDHSIGAVAINQEASTYWDDAALRARQRPLDLKWIDDNLGVWFHTYYQIDETYLLDPAGSSFELQSLSEQYLGTDVLGSISDEAEGQLFGDAWRRTAAEAAAERQDEPGRGRASTGGRRSRAEDEGLVGQVVGSTAFRSMLRSAGTVIGREITRSIFGTGRRRR